jgi:putative transposase
MRSTRPRLNPAFYHGLQRCFLTFCTCNRQAFFIEYANVDLVREQILNNAGPQGIAIIAYCFMPDHIHLLVEGVDDESDVTVFVHQAKQHSAYAFRKATQQKLWQPSYYDRILRDEEETLRVARYIFENPVRKGIVDTPKDYAFLGSMRYTIEQILDAASWQP